MNLKASLILAFALGAGGSAFASPSPAGAAACKSIESTCEAAGYVRHSKEKNLRRDCVEPILSGRTVTGVAAVKAADVKACEEHRAAKTPTE